MQNEELAVQQLFESALNEKDEDVRWNFIKALHKSGTRKTFESAKKLCESDLPFEVDLGASVLGQLGYPDMPFRAETTSLLLEISKTETDLEALQSITFALGRMHEPAAIRRLLELKDHESEAVRYAVVHGLLTGTEEPGIQALIELSRDPDEDVRNWATFGLGSQIETDTSEIRDALFDRLSEEDREIRGEALVGLALRKDERVIEPLIKELMSNEVGILAVEAAVEITDKRLCRALKKLQKWWDADKEYLAEAIKNCCPGGK